LSVPLIQSYQSPARIPGEQLPILLDSSALSVAACGMAPRTKSDTGVGRNQRFFSPTVTDELDIMTNPEVPVMHSPGSLQELSSADSDLESVHSVQSMPSLPEISLRRCKIDSDEPSDMSDSSVSADETQPEIPRRIRGPADMLGNPLNNPFSGLEAKDHRLNSGRRATHSVPKPGPRPLKYPRHSAVVPSPSTLMAQSSETLPPVKLTLSKQDREQFLQGVSPRIPALVNQPFGKENLLQCFKSEARFSHVCEM